ncbi:MAG: hypothetical protein SVG88_09185 [Halobacteriales archaeon]|nr:hypothetical protein [Halobacteriales archaeon]
MAEDDLAAAVDSALAVDRGAFQSAVEAEADFIKDELGDGAFDNAQGSVGLEYEFYAANRDTGALMRVPRRLLTLIGFEKELGLHNAEMSTTPQPFNEYGIQAQAAEVRARLSAALDRTAAEGMALISDALWTIPPTGERARDYLTDSVEKNGIRIATNMSDAVRYHAMANSETPAGMEIDAPNVSLTADTIMPESLITSLQPHYQVPQAIELPTYFGYALRIAGPLLAVGVNSPFFPPDLYDDDVTAETVLVDAHMEHRIGVFESVMNTDDQRKVRFPEDLETAWEAVDRVVEDETIVPKPVESGSRFDDEFAHFRLKHGSYWRWVRPVFEGHSRSAAHARIEFRPIPAQPTVRDTLAFQAAFAGALVGMVAADHPVRTLDWNHARENFYAAVREGLNAEFKWIDRDAHRCSDNTEIIEDILRVAADGLRARGLSDAEVGRVLGPLRRRVRRGTTPARWKHRRVGQHVADGCTLEEAITRMQQEYIDRQADTLFEGTLVEWLDG